MEFKVGDRVVGKCIKRGVDIRGMSGKVWSGYVIIDKESGKALVGLTGTPSYIYRSLRAVKDAFRCLSDNGREKSSIKKVSLVIDE